MTKMPSRETQQQNKIEGKIIKTTFMGHQQHFQTHNPTTELICMKLGPTTALSLLPDSSCTAVFNYGGKSQHV